FIVETFGYLTFYEVVGGGFAEVRSAVTEAIRQCVEGGLVERNGQYLFPTQVARIFGAAGLSLASCVRLVLVLERAAGASLTRQDLVFEVASCAEVGDRPWPIRRSGVTQDPRPNHAPDGSDCSPRSQLAAVLSRSTISIDEMKALVRARCLLEWMSGTSLRSISRQFQNMGASAARVRDLGKSAGWLLDSLAEAARIRGDLVTPPDNVRTLAVEARYGVAAKVAPIARLQFQSISRDQLVTLHQQGQDLDLADPTVVLDAPEEAFKGILSALQIARLKQAIVVDIHDSMVRKRAGHLARAEHAAIPRRVVEELYNAEGAALEQAVADA